MQIQDGELYLSFPASTFILVFCAVSFIVMVMVVVHTQAKVHQREVGLRELLHIRNLAKRFRDDPMEGRGNQTLAALVLKRCEEFEMQTGVQFRNLNARRREEESMG